MIKNLKDFNGRELDHYDECDLQISNFPEKGHKYIFHYEKSFGEYNDVDHFYIITLNENNVELRRNALTLSMSLFWKEPDVSVIGTINKEKML